MISAGSTPFFGMSERQFFSELVQESFPASHGIANMFGSKEMSRMNSLMEESSVIKRAMDDFSRISSQVATAIESLQMNQGRRGFLNYMETRPNSNISVMGHLKDQPDYIERISSGSELNNPIWEQIMNQYDFKVPSQIRTFPWSDQLLLGEVMENPVWEILRDDVLMSPESTDSVWTSPIKGDLESPTIQLALINDEFVPREEPADDRSIPEMLIETGLLVVCNMSGCDRKVWYENVHDHEEFVCRHCQNSGPGFY